MAASTKIIHNLPVEYMHSFKQELNRTTWIERVFLFCSFVMAIGFIHFDAFAIRFAKYGISLPLPSRFGEIHNQSPKLFVTEIYILILFSLTMMNWRNFKSQLLLSLSDSKRVLFLLLTFFCFGMIRALYDIKLNPVLGIRNAAFVWYLCIPVFIWLLPIRATILEALFGAIQVFAFFHLVICNFGVFIYDGFPLYWFPCIGLVAPMVYALLTPKKSVAVWILISVSFLLAMGIVFGSQRTTLLGMIFGIVGIFWFYMPLYWQFFKRLSFVVICTFLIFFTFQFSRVAKQFFQQTKEAYISGKPFSTPSQLLFSSFQLINPLVKAETNDQGLEIFRTQLWGDAWQLFKEHPLLGIGFQKQVVYRAYAGAGHYVSNDGNFESYTWRVLKNRAPIAGPHNSYLNAITRMGIIGTLILLIHFFLLHILFIRRYWAGFFLLFQGVIYAFFNIGLEGPTRSFFLLLAMGLALKVLISEKVNFQHE